MGHPWNDGHVPAELQQPHPPPWPPDGLAWAEPTAKALNCRRALFLPQLGHSTLSALDMLRTSFSNRALQDSQTYS